MVEHFQMSELAQLRHSTSGRGLFLLVSSLSVALNAVTIFDPEEQRTKRLTIAMDLLKLLELVENQVTKTHFSWQVLFFAFEID